MSRRRIVAGAVPAVLVTAAVAAASLEPPTSSQVEATIVFDHVEGKGRACLTDDGREFFQERLVVRGEVTGDPLLDGRLTVHLVGEGTEDGLSQERGRWRIRGDDGVWKAQGGVHLTGIDEINQGILEGETRTPDEPAAYRGRLLAGLRVSFNDDFSITGQIGGDLPDGRLPATHFNGICRGPYEHFEAEIPPPGSTNGIAARSGAAAKRWGR